MISDMACSNVLSDPLLSSFKRLPPSIIAVKFALSLLDCVVVMIAGIKCVSNLFSKKAINFISYGNKKRLEPLFVLYYYNYSIYLRSS